MKTRLFRTALGAAVALAGSAVFSGCSSDGYSGSDNVDVYGSVYLSAGYPGGFYGSPWYGPGYYPPPVVVAPPPYRPPGGGGVGGGARPTPMPAGRGR